MFVRRFDRSFKGSLEVTLKLRVLEGCFFNIVRFIFCGSKDRGYSEHNLDEPQ